MPNETSEFLGPDNNWYSSSISLEDIQSSHSSIKLNVKGSGLVTAILIEPRKQRRRYWFFLKKEESQHLKQLLLEQNFITIPSEETGDSDARKLSLSLSNGAKETHTVSNQPGVDDRFDAIFNALQDIVQQAKNHKPILPPEPRWLTIAKVLSIGLLALAIILLARVLSKQILSHLGVENPPALVLPILLLTGAILLLLGCSVFLEWLTVRGKSFFSRPVSLLTLIIGILYCINITLVVGFLLDVSMVQWGEPTIGSVQTKYTGFSYDSETGVSSTTYHLKYQYQIPTGQSYKRRVSVKRSYYNKLNEGDSVTVFYLPQWPSWSALEAATSATSRASFLFTSLLTLIGWLLAIGITTYALLPILQQLQ